MIQGKNYEHKKMISGRKWVITRLFQGQKMTRVEGVRDESGFGEGESKGLLFLGEIGRAFFWGFLQCEGSFFRKNGRGSKGSDQGVFVGFGKAI